MKCEKCLSEFPTKCLIDGKIRNLCKRKYCLNCSPFGKHNTRKPLNGTKPQKVCPICKKQYSHKGTKCNTCRVYLWRKFIKKRLIDYKGGKCIICGYCKSQSSLHFHHRNPNEKEFQIGGKTRSFDNLKAEVDKCELVCSNCHGEIHDGLINL